MAKSKKVNKTKRTNRMIIAGATIIVVVILLIAGVFAYTDIFKEEKPVKEKEGRSYH